MNRRALLALCGSLGTATLAGCVGVPESDSEPGDEPASDTEPGDAESDDPENDGSSGGPEGDDSDVSPPEGYVRPESDPEVVPEAFECSDEGFERLGRRYAKEDLRFGDTERFALRISDRSFEYGDTAEIALRNVSEERSGTGNPNKYNLELYTEDGWIELRGAPADAPIPITDELLEHDPGEGFEWELELTEEGVPAGHMHEGDLRVCPDLVSGRYRFTFWGVPDRSNETDTGVAVEFDLTRG